MKSSRRTAGAPATGAAAELHRDAFGVLAHDLGSLTAALELRADVLAPALAVPDLAALRALADELRDLSRTLRLLRGPQGREALSPARPLPLDEWWRMVSRLTTAVLPRAVLVDARVGAEPLTPAEAHGLTYIWLAACKDLARLGVQAPCTVTLSSACDARGHGTTVRAVVPAEALPARDRSLPPGRWRHQADRLAAGAGASLAWWTNHGAQAEWSCTIGGGAAP